MELKDIAELLITMTGKVEFYWDFFTIMVLALIGWVVSTNKVFTRRLKFLIAVGYLIFAFMNLLGLWSSYSFAEALRLDLLSVAQTTPDTLKNTQVVLSQWSFGSQKIFAIFIHFILAILVLSVVWSGRFSIPRENKAE
ncbi:hypothetical protein Lepto7375DRAFT_0706 [Leptolyngbya sp. PCC 7375]|nr:hypothetical protein Lepto7375DRAFT_0706 [Leptolyngbya sp. PCC 7375]